MRPTAAAPRGDQSTGVPARIREGHPHHQGVAHHGVRHCHRQARVVGHVPARHIAGPALPGDPARLTCSPQASAAGVLLRTPPRSGESAFAAEVGQDIRAFLATDREFLATGQRSRAAGHEPRGDLRARDLRDGAPARRATLLPVAQERTEAVGTHHHDVHRLGQLRGACEQVQHRPHGVVDLQVPQGSIVVDRHEHLSCAVAHKS